MPELPEVETTLRGVMPFIKNAKITDVIVRHYGLRWPIPPNLSSLLTHQTIHTIRRRAKYLVFGCDSGSLIIHLGMSGKLRVLSHQQSTVVLKHDHVDIIFNNHYILRYNDPRRFGAMLWCDSAIDDHPLLRDLGPEPLTQQFNAVYLSQKIQSRQSSIKTLIMNNKIVVGVGNIYANEALFLAGIYPKTRAGKMSIEQCASLVKAIKHVLEKAIAAGGTTLKDFRKTDGKPGYFAQELNVYGRNDQPCHQCGTDIIKYNEIQRATFYCPLCQQ